MAQFSEELKLNKYIKNVLIKNKKGVSKAMNQELERQIKYNKAIHEQLKPGKKVDSNAKNLQLTHLKDVSFLPKMIADFSSLEVLDLSSSDLRSKDSINQVCIMIDENETLRELKLTSCKLNARGLSILADALTKLANKNLKILDIRDNPIEDE